MALSWVLLVVVFALHNGFSEAQNDTTVAAAPPTTSFIAAATPTTSLVASATNNAATTTSTTASASQTAAATTPATTAGAPPPSTASPSDGFYTYLNVIFKSSECTADKDTLLKSRFRDFYAHAAVFDFIEISFLVERDTCVYNFTIKFGPNLQMYNISEVFEDELKSLNYTVGTLKLTDVKTEVYVPGFTPGAFESRPDDCNKICCDGAGGPITVYRNCSSSNKCRSYKIEKIESDCMNVCECSGVTMMCKISLLVLLFGAFMNWFLK